MIKVVRAVQQSREVFNGNIAILSNSVGSSDDLDFAHATSTEQSIGIAVIRHKIKKPGCIKEVREMSSKMAVFWVVTDM